jgi:hypothetical protein
MAVTQPHKMAISKTFLLFPFIAGLPVERLLTLNLFGGFFAYNKHYVNQGLNTGFIELLILWYISSFMLKASRFVSK